MRSKRGVFADQYLFVMFSLPNPKLNPSEMTKSDDLKLILVQIAAGSEKAFRYIFTLYSNKVYKYAMKFTHTKELSEEIVQEVFIKIWVNRRALTSVNYFSSYLYTITKNHTLNSLKHLSIEAKATRIFGETSSFVQAESTHLEERHVILQHAVEKLPKQQQLVYKMCYHEGMGYEEVAQRLSISRLTVKTHMQQALRFIRGQLVQSPCIK